MFLAALLLLSPPECLPHVGRQRLEGVLVAQTFPGPPNFESIKRGDRPERYWLLRLPRPICIADDPNDPQGGAGARDVRQIQLVLDHEDFARYRPMFGEPIIAKGSFMSPLSGHHHTSILLEGVTLARRP